MPLPAVPLTFTIETPRCRLRVPSPDDIPHSFEATQHPGFNDGMMWDPPETPEALGEPLQ